jgi:hypothetical protein
MLIMTSQIINAESNSTITLDNGTMTTVDIYVDNYIKEHSLDIGSLYYLSFIKNSSYTDILIYIFLIILLIMFLLSIIHWILFEWTDFFYRFILPVGSMFLSYYVSDEIGTFYNLNEEYSFLVLIIFILIFGFIPILFLNFRQKRKNNYTYLHHFNDEINMFEGGFTNGGGDGGR